MKYDNSARLAKALDRDEILRRFESKVSKSVMCWQWTGCTVRLGYGRFSIAGVPMAAHRAAYQLFVGPIPKGLDIDHLCRNPGCVNPSHLEPVTRRENTLRGFGRPAVQARQVRCKRGHEFSAENTQAEKDGSRRCRECRRASQRAVYRSLSLAERAKRVAYRREWRAKRRFHLDQEAAA